jgi:rod shape-determining protein MreC
MRNLLRFIIKQHFTILFVVLELLAFILIAQFNSFHRAKLFSIRFAIVGSVSEKFTALSRYLHLREENEYLVKENAILYNRLPEAFFELDLKKAPDTAANRKYVFMHARVINNSVNKQYNFITLNKGRKQGVEAEMAVVCDEGIVGQVKAVSDNFASVVSVLNRESFPPAKIKRTGEFGYIEWPGTSYRKVVLKEIPYHAEVLIGDTVVTSGYSAIYPEGFLIGTVTESRITEGRFKELTVKLSTDFKRLDDVMVVKNLLREEQINLEEKQEDD